MHQIQGTLTPRPPFDFNKSLQFLGHFRPAMGQQTTHDGILTKASALDGQIFAFQVSSTGTVDHPEIAYRLFSENEILPACHEAVRQNLSFFLSLDDDLAPFYAVAEEDSAFEPIMQELYGYHQVKFLSPFEKAN
jgi:DNA-3-methyladenine glycosylase II